MQMELKVQENIKQHKITGKEGREHNSERGKIEQKINAYTNFCIVLLLLSPHRLHRIVQYSQHLWHSKISYFILFFRTYIHK